MLSLNLDSPQEKQIKIAERMKTLRLLHEFKRKTLSLRSGVSLASIIRFERTGEISLHSLCKLASALGVLDQLDKIFEVPPARSIDELEKRDQLALQLKTKTKRGRK